MFDFFRALFAGHDDPPKPARTPARTPRGLDAELTRQAAEMLRSQGCEEMAARVRVCWSARLTSTAGLAKPAQAQVTLNPRLREFPGEVDRTLRHEVAHLVVSVRHRGKRRVAAHGPEWRQACAALGIADESRCHTLPLPRKQRARPHAYRCPKCEFVLRRTRAIKPRTRLACRTCCKLHAGGRFDARFELEKFKA